MVGLWKKRPLPFVFAALMGFAGGATVELLLQHTQVHAQDRRYTPQVLQAQRLELIDQEGTKRGDWFVDRQGQVHLRLLEKDGTVLWDETGHPQGYPATQK